MLEFATTLTSFSVDGPLVNVAEFLKPFAGVAKNLATLIGLAPMK